ncbi:MAG: N-formylglutamate amidohydrolase [Methylocystis sp.]|nr:N-formylglutamate amidohydrolase [Methylocystis sp.]MCA3582631.1 N-formylglutamate amidohydrolase [Methylocystis sp.]MCA3589495.1 N-formylglutamate amidohydrolase [Methylocystis sp.]MCA3591696.1 N-formylglutamate amidohydrolase [Methylocystis sp.]
MAQTASEVVFDPPFEIDAPGRLTLPFVVNTPHSGRVYPDAFLAMTRLDRLGLRRSEDCYVDLLFAEAPRIGLPLLKAHFPRAYLDVNREPYELDPRMFDGRLPAYANTRSMRVAGGLGSIPRIVGDGQDIYRARLTVTDAMRRIDTVYRPYHRALRGLLQETHRRFGEAILLDCHSMPSASLGAESQLRPDIVLGDRYGTSCAPVLIDIVQASFEALGYRVARNRPYAGGFITEHYGQPASAVHALQIEINRALYMDEETLEPRPDFATVQRDLTRMLVDAHRSLSAASNTWSQAAE